MRYRFGSQAPARMWGPALFQRLFLQRSVTDEEEHLCCGVGEIGACFTNTGDCTKTG